MILIGGNGLLPRTPIQTLLLASDSVSAQPASSVFD